MLDFLLEAHSGWRYVVLLAMILMVLFYAYEYFTRTTLSQEKQVDLIFATSIHIQILLGILLLIAYFLDDLFQSRQIGHVVVMLILLPLTIFYSRWVRRFEAVDDIGRRRLLGLLTPIAAFVIVLIGLAAIQVSLVG